MVSRLQALHEVLYCGLALRTPPIDQSWNPIAALLTFKAAAAQAFAHMTGRTFGTSDGELERPYRLWHEVGKRPQLRGSFE
jgi:hypothetical protein